MKLRTKQYIFSIVFILMLCIIPSMAVLASNKGAVGKAKSYIRTMAFSYEGLIEQLEFEKFSHEEAIYGVDNCGADWNQQAIKKANSYMKVSPFSYDELVGQLEFDKFTHEQAVLGANSIFGDSSPSISGMTISQENALKKAKRYLSLSGFSYKSLVSQLEFDKFSHEDAVFAVNNCGADWNEQAVKKAKAYLKVMAFSRAGLISQLEFEGFTNEQAAYGVSAVGL